MGKADNLSLSGTTNKKRIAKKNIPQATEEETVAPIKTPTPVKVKAPIPKKEKLKKTNFQLTEAMHMNAKITAMEMGVSLKDYITSLIKADLKKRGKL